jgi:hypothetical protein
MQGEGPDWWSQGAFSLALKGCSRSKRMKMGKESRDKQVYCYNVCKATKAIINNIRML